MQNAGSSRVMPVTVRTLESMIRLSTAHAKCRLNDTVDIIDCLKAVELIVFTLFGVDDEDTYGENVIRTGEDGKMEEEQSSHQAGGNGASERSKPTRVRKQALIILSKGTILKKAWRLNTSIRPFKPSTR